MRRRALWALARLTDIGALGQDGMIAALAIKAATDGAVIATYLTRVLFSALRTAEPDAARNGQLEHL